MDSLVIIRISGGSQTVAGLRDRRAPYPAEGDTRPWKWGGSNWWVPGCQAAAPHHEPWVLHHWGLRRGGGGVHGKSGDREGPQ